MRSVLKSLKQRQKAKELTEAAERDAVASGRQAAIRTTRSSAKKK